MTSTLPESTISTLLVSTYLFVRCNNHKSVWHLCEEVSWLSPELKLIYLCLRRCLNYSWLILVQVPLYPEICIPFFFSLWYPWLLPAPTRWRHQIQIGTSFNQTFPSTKLIGTWSRTTCLTALLLLQPSSFNAKGRPLSQTFIPIGFANTLCISVHVPVFLTQLTDAQATTQSSFSKALTWSGHPGPGVAVHSSAGLTLRTMTIATDLSANNFTALAGLTPNSLPSEAGPWASTGHIGSPFTAASPTSTARLLCTSRTTRTSTIASPTRPICPIRTSSSILGKKPWIHPWRTSWTHHLMSHHLQPTTTMTNESNSDESNARGAKPIPRAYFRDFTNYLSSGGEQFAPFANWQIPTRLLSDTYALLRRNYNDEGSSNTMTWWGLLSRQSSLHSDQREYTEQTLTIPLPTNTADPEIAILTSFFYTKMNQERALAFQTNPGNPIATTKAFLQEWLSFAGDQYRLSINQRGTSARFSYNVGSVILDLLTANIPEHQRVWADTDPNIQVDPISGRLQFHRWDETAVNHLSEVVESRRWATTDCCTADLSPISFDTPGPKWHRVYDSRWDTTHELGTESLLSIHIHQLYAFMFWSTFLSHLWFLWMFQDRHLCNKFAMTNRSHNTAQTLRHWHMKRSLTKWDTHDGRSA